MLLAQLDLGIAGLHSVKRLSMLVAVMHKSHYLRSHATSCSKGNSVLLH